MRWCLASLLAVPCVVSLAVAQAESPSAALRGLRSITVFVEDLNPYARSLSLTAEDVRTQVELKLRMAGLRVGSGGPAVFDVEIYVATNNDVKNLAVFGIHTSARELTTLRRNGAAVLATLWGYEATGWAGEARAKQTILDAVASQADSFLNAWLAANPK